MDIQIPRITKTLDLGEYADELAGVLVYVWVNPPRDVMNVYFELTKENSAAMEAAQTAPDAKLIKEINRIGEAFVEWWRELWSQGKDPDTHWTTDGVVTLITSDTDPQLYGWICRESMRLITEHKAAGKKK